MAIDVTALVDYAWSDIAKAAKTAMISSALGGATLSIGGRQIGRITIDEAEKLYVLATERAAIDAGTAGNGQAFAAFHDPS